MRLRDRVATIALGSLLSLVGVGPGDAQTIIRPPTSVGSGITNIGGQTIIRPPASTAPPAGAIAQPTTVRSFTYTPRAGVVVGPELPAYRFSGYGANYGYQTAGAGGYAGYAGFPGYGYSSRYGSPAYGYGAYKAYYGFPGYNRVGPPYAVRGYQGALYGPGFTPNVGYGAGYTMRGYGAFTPLGR